MYIGWVLIIRVRATDRHCRKMRRNNKFGAKNCHLATTIGERKIASENFCLASERHLRLKSLPRAALCNCQLTPQLTPNNSVAYRVEPGHALLLTYGDRHTFNSCYR